MKFKPTKNVGGVVVELGAKESQLPGESPAKGTAPLPAFKLKKILVPIDFSQGTEQEYVEDCPVCCQANVIHVEIDEEGGANVWAELE